MGRESFRKISRKGLGGLEKEFDWKLFTSLCELPEVISQEDIARCMKLSVDTCARRVEERFPGESFAGYRRRNQSKFRVNLINKQIQVALSGNVVMLKWLGVNYLGQSEQARNLGSDSDEKLIIDLSGEYFKATEEGKE